ncbi:MAG: LacI family DNA-binding transcriptional regulator, partial [Nakamurella sp.]
MATPQRARPPGLYDVAKLAGVSHQTVSRVINSHPSVRDETRQRVQDAITELGYRPNVAARTLVTRHSNTIGVITSVSPFWGPSSTLIGVERAARDAGFYLSVAGLRSIEPAAVKDVLGHFHNQGVEGIVVIAPEAALAHMAQPFVTDLPVVMVAAGAEPAPGVQITSIDQERGARLATRHLIELGHTRIGHIAGPEPWFDATARHKGWRRELAESGLRPGPQAAGDWTAASGNRIGLQWVARKRLPSAIFVANDLMALGF